MGEVDFPIYIYKSDIVILIKLIREQLSSDYDGQYEVELVLNLLHEPLNSLVVYLSKDLQNAKDVEGQLRCGPQSIEIDEKDCYVRLLDVLESYQDLKKI